MAENTKIEWATHTFNPWYGCTKVSPGCDHCYAEAMMDKRMGKVKWGPHGDRVRTSETYWKQPMRWARKAREALQDFEEGMLTVRSARPRVFCASLADVFDNQVPPEWRVDLWKLIWATPELDWLILTKRPENISKMLPVSWLSHPDDWQKNVWLGFTAEDQENFDRRWPIISQIPAAVRFCSYEPAIGSLRLHLNGPHPDWIICGGESGRGHREMLGCWETDIRHDCKQAGVSYFFKQMAGKRPIPADFPLVRQFPLTN